MTSNSIYHKDKLINTTPIMDWNELVKDPLMQAARCAPYTTEEEIRKNFGDDVIEEFRKFGMLDKIGTHIPKEAYWYDTADVDNGVPLVGKSVRHADGSWHFMRTLGPSKHNDINHRCPIGRTYSVVVSLLPKKKGSKRFKFYFNEEQQKTAFNKIAKMTLFADVKSHMSLESSESEDGLIYVAVWTICNLRGKLFPSSNITRDEIIEELSSELFYKKFDERLAVYLRLEDGDHRNSSVDYRAHVSRDAHSYETFKIV